jgi:hypothetical protein
MARQWLTLLQDLVGLTKLPVLTLELADPRRLRAGRPGPLADIALRLTRPDAQAVGRAPELLGQRSQRGDFTGVLRAMLQEQPYGAFTELGRVRLPADLLVHGRQSSESSSLR